MFVDLCPPIKKDFYMEKLSSDDLETFYVIKQMVDMIGSSFMGGQSFTIMADNYFDLVDRGLILPVVNRQGSDYLFRTDYWSFQEGRFKRIDDMSMLEVDLLAGILQRLYDVN